QDEHRRGQIRQTECPESPFGAQCPAVERGIAVTCSDELQRIAQREEHAEYYRWVQAVLPRPRDGASDDHPRKRRNGTPNKHPCLVTHRSLSNGRLSLG